MSRLLMSMRLMTITMITHMMIMVTVTETTRRMKARG